MGNYPSDTAVEVRREDDNSEDYLEPEFDLTALPELVRDVELIRQRRDNTYLRYMCKW